MISTCLSITESIDENCFAAVFMHFPLRYVVKGLFSLDGKSIDPASGSKDIWDFMKRKLFNPAKTQVIIAVRSEFLVIRAEDIPVLALEANSLFLNILRYLSQTNYCAFLQRPLPLIWSRESREVVLVTPGSVKPAEFAKGADEFATLLEEVGQGHINPNVLIMKSPREGFSDPPPHKLMIIRPTVAHAYAHFLFGTCRFPSEVAMAAGHIAYNESLYYYFASQGLVHSSQDLVQLFRQFEFQRASIPQTRRDSRERSHSSVVSAKEVYTVKIGKYSCFDDVDRIPLKYAVAVRKCQESSRVSEADAQKFALLAVCKFWRMRLYCKRFKFEYLFRSDRNEEEYLIFDPQQSSDPWITSTIS